MHPRLPLLPAFLLSTLLGCKHAAAPPQCYAGVVLGQTCMDGVLIQVNEQTPIGRPVQLAQAASDSIVGTNVVAAVNNLNGLNRVGQVVYFTYAASPGNRGPVRTCTQNTAPLAIPHLVLGNTSATPCAQ